MNRAESTIENQIIALAAIAQAASLIDQLARSGTDEQEAFKPLIYGLLQTNPQNTEAVFVNRKQLRPGLEVLSRLLQQTDIPQNRQRQYSEIMRLCLSMLHLQRRLIRRPEMLNTISDRLQQIEKQVNHFTLNDELDHDLPSALCHESVLANIASLYLDTLSTFRFRIQVNGNPAHLQQENVIHKIRSLLLCGIRAAVLWQQTGGNRLAILLKRKQYAKACTTMLEEISRV